MTYDYDSFNRMQQMTYPEGEVVSYHYNRGGMLDSIGGRKGTHAYPYIAHIAYNRFELKDSVRYGNGALNAYHYDKLQRLDTLKSFTGDTTSRNMQYLVYDYDAVGNILNINNLADTVNALGGRYGIQYIYDDLYRLTKADGHWDGIPDTSYSVAMKYYANGRIMNKKVANTSTIVNNGFDTPIDYARKYTYVSGTSKLYKISETNGLAQQFGWDGSGNMVWHQNVSKQCDRRYCWDEDNRLQGAIDCHYASFYQYDAGGGRTYKLTGKNVQQGTNANIQNYPMFDNPTLYASPYVICTPKGYTKHYNAESERVASRIGNSCLKDLCTTLNVTADFNREDTSGNVYLYDCQQDNEAFLEKIDTNEAHLGKVMECLQSEKETVKSGLDKLHAYIECPGEQEQECYWYHPDHLGSSSWITFADGTPAATPFAHLHISSFANSTYNSSPITHNSSHSFSAKERDAETGLSYFISRYYSADLSIWLSVDPMSGKYPSFSSYVYCADNPVRCVDPNGEEIGPIWPKKGVNTYSGKLKAGIGVGYGFSISGMAGISLDSHGMTHWIAYNSKYIANQNLYDGSMNPAIEVGVDLSLSGSIERNSQYDSFIESVKSSSMTFNLGGKALVGGALGIGNDSFSFGLGVGVSIGASSDPYVITESISLSKPEAKKIGYTSTWTVVDQKYDSSTNTYQGVVQSDGKKQMLKYPAPQWNRMVYEDPMECGLQLIIDQDNN